jgi:cell division transport system permease protein
MPYAVRRSAADDLGMRRALSDRLLPLLVAAMVFLAALALTGAMAASGLAARWSSGPAAMITVTVPLAGKPPQGKAAGPPVADAAMAVLAASPATEKVRRLSDAEIGRLLKPWLGEDPGQLSLRLPAMFELRLKPGMEDPGLAARLAAAAPGAVMEHNGEWLGRLAALIRSLQACASLALLVVIFIAAAVVGIATRAGLAARRDSIEIVHGLGATDGLIAGQFAHRITVLVLGGALLGALLALPVLLGLARLAAPFRTGIPAPAGVLDLLPPPLWELLAALPVFAAVIGWTTAQGTVRVWLRRLP